MCIWSYHPPIIHIYSAVTGKGGIFKCALIPSPLSRWCVLTFTSSQISKVPPLKVDVCLKNKSIGCCWGVTIVSSSLQRIRIVRLIIISNSFLTVLNDYPFYLMVQQEQIMFYLTQRYTRSYIYLYLNLDRITILIKIAHCFWHLYF
jgi:hypothetical protein